MAENITNIVEASQRIGALSHQLETEEAARKDAQAALQTAQADHTAAVEKLEADHKAEVEKLTGNHATETTKLNDQLASKEQEIVSLSARVEELEGEAQTAAQGAAKIVGQAGTSAAGPDDPAPAPESKTPEQLAEAWAENGKLSTAAERRAHYLKHIKPFDR